MKHLKVFTVLAFLFVANAVSAQSTFDKWPAIKEFHDVMSETFHPAEKGNLAPIKARSEEMMNKAALVVKLDIPAHFKTETILAAAERLHAKSKALHELIIAKGSDSDILKSITELHDVFHTIVDLCSDEK